MVTWGEMSFQRSALSCLLVIFHLPSLVSLPPLTGRQGMLGVAQPFGCEYTPPPVSGGKFPAFSGLGCGGGGKYFQELDLDSRYFLSKDLDAGQRTKWHEFSAAGLERTCAKFLIADSIVRFSMVITCKVGERNFGF